MPGKELYQFGQFRLDVEERQLFFDDQLVHLEPKVLEILIIFVRNQGQLLKKEYLKNELDLNSEAVLARHVSVLRKTLGDSRFGQRKYIQTDWKSGYRFLASVQRITSDQNFIVDEEEIADPLVQPSIPKRNYRRLSLIFLLFAVSAITILFLQQRRVEEQVKHVVQESQVVETLQIYTNPEGFDLGLLRKYWLSEEEGGIEIINVKNTIQRLRCEGTRYGAESKLEWFKFREIKISALGFGSSAVVETDEYWYLPKYDKNGDRIPIEEKNLFMRTSPKYELQKKAGNWLIVRSGVPRRIKPCPTPSPK
jgi:DNA-binding winged helix-turn-helix (wHTH) protein